ncbi:MAG: DUF3352 domain-containing protein [Bacteroidota bacterium]
MKKALKILLYLILIVIVGVLGFFGYIYFSESENRDPFSIIPDDAVYIIETDNLDKGWNELSNSKIWSHLMGNEYFSDINEDAEYFSSLIKNNRAVEMLLKNRKLLISIHMISGVDYDFIFVADVEKASKVSFLSDALNLMNYTVKKRDYKGVEIIELTDNESNDVLYLSIIDNLLAGSYTGSLIEKVIDQKENVGWKDDEKFLVASSEIKSKYLFKFYLNYKMLPKYLKCYLSEESENIKDISSILAYSVFNVDFQNEMLSFTGFTNFNDSLPSYINALAQVDPGSISAFRIMPNKMALYLSLCFKDFNSFYNRLSEQFANEDSTEYENINKNIERVEKFLKVDLNEVFFSWIGEEIAFIKMQPETNAREEDVVIIFHTKDIEQAKEGMDKLLKQVKKRSPVKFEMIDYKGFEINFLNIKGFFKLFLGKMFGKLEKPYFTYIEDFVVFSNSPSSLMDFIDEYSTENTLSHNEEFMSFKNELSNKANVTIFVQMPRIYQHLLFYGDKDTRESIKGNREIVLSFARVGFQLISEKKLFKTKIIAFHDPNALMYEELEKMENSADQLFLEEFDSLRYKPQLPDSFPITDGLVQYYFKDSLKKDSVLLYEGMLVKGKTDGLWRTFYKSGNIYSAIVYKDGAADGSAMFYYDNKESINRVEISFEEDVIDGIYKEFYENGSVKVNIEFRDGKMHGDAEYYYDSDMIKIIGEYRDGIKKGKWKYYTETGELIDKENWRKLKEPKSTENEIISNQ